MNAFAQRENARILAATIGVGEDQAAELLDVSAVVTHDPEDFVAAEFAKHVLALLGRTLRSVQPSAMTSNRLVAVEVVIGAARPRFNCPHIFVHAMDEEFVVTSQPVGKCCGKIHRVGILLGACYATAAAVKMALGDVLPFHVPSVIRVGSQPERNASSAELNSASTPQPSHFNFTGFCGWSSCIRVLFVRLISVSCFVNDDFCEHLKPT